VPRKYSRNKRGSKRSTRKNSADELQRIEDLLDEDFESLSQARKAFKHETGLAPGKDSYTVKELSHRKHATVKTFLPDLEEHRKEVDALKKKSDFWAAEIYGNGTYSLYSDIDALARRIGTYKGLQEENPRQALRNIKIIRVKNVDASEYIRQRILAKEESKRLGKLKGKENRKRERDKDRKIAMLKKQLRKERAKNRRRK
jgi:hypothetical protein